MIAQVQDRRRDGLWVEVPQGRRLSAGDLRWSASRM